jgi:hypothetical protein
MFTHDHDRFVDPRVAHVRDHDAQVGKSRGDRVDEDRPRYIERGGADERRALVPDDRQPQPLRHLVNGERAAVEGMDALVNRPDLQSAQAERSRAVGELGPAPPCRAVFGRRVDEEDGANGCASFA